MHNRFGLLAIISIWLCSCGGEQPAPATPVQTSKHSFPEAMKMLCNVDQLANLNADDDPLAVGRNRTAWLSDQVDNGDFIEFRTLVSVKGPEEQVQKIRAKAKEVGVTPCPVADSIEANPTGVLIP
jgi:hypothetical protein